ncbi:hypothetical protein KIPB_006823, partial [Kipferlia bialata]
KSGPSCSNCETSFILQFHFEPTTKDTRVVSPTVSITVLRKPQDETGCSMEYVGMLGDGRILLRARYGVGLWVAPLTLLDKTAMSQEMLDGVYSNPDSIFDIMDYKDGLEEDRPVPLEYPGMATKGRECVLSGSLTPTHVLPLYKSGATLKPIAIVDIMTALEQEQRGRERESVAHDTEGEERDTDAVTLNVETAPHVFGQTVMVAADSVYHASYKVQPATPLFTTAVEESMAMLASNLRDVDYMAPDAYGQEAAVTAYCPFTQCVTPLPSPHHTQMATTLSEAEVSASAISLGDACDLDAIAKLTQFSQYAPGCFEGSTDNGITPVELRGRYIKDTLPPGMDVYKISHAPKHYRIRYALVSDTGADPLSIIPEGLRHPDMELIEEGRLGDMMGAPVWKGCLAHPLSVESGFVIGFDGGRRDGGARIGTQHPCSCGITPALSSDPFSPYRTDWVGIPVLVSLPGGTDTDTHPKATYDWDEGVLASAGLNYPLPDRAFDVPDRGCDTVDIAMGDPDAASGRWNIHVRSSSGYPYAETVALHESITLPDNPGDTLFQTLAVVKDVSTRFRDNTETIGAVGGMDGVGEWYQMVHTVGVSTNRAGFFTTHLYGKRQCVSVGGLGESGPEAYVFDEESQSGVGWQSVTGQTLEASVPGGWYSNSDCINVTYVRSCLASVPGGWYSNSGWGDGSYPCFVLRDRAGKAVGARILYITEDDVEEGEEEAEVPVAPPVRNVKRVRAQRVSHQ